MSSSGVQHIVEAQGVSVSFGGVLAVEDVSMAVRTGQTTGLIGPNGAGKTTLFNILTGLIRPDHGTVRVKGYEVQGQSPTRIALAGVGRTFQGAHVVTRLSTWDNVMLGAKGNPGEKLRGYFTPKKCRTFDEANRPRAEELLEAVNLLRLKDEFAGNLSGGQRKLLDFVRAMMGQPEVLLLDEPFAGVNPTLRQSLIELMRHLQTSEGTSFLLVEHDLPAVMKMSDHVYVMAEGHIIYSGTPEGVLEQADVVDAYLGPTGGGHS